MADVGARIRALRQSLKMTHQKVADSVGVSKTSVIYWEKGENVPKHEHLNALARTLDTSTDYILYGEDGRHNENYALKELMRNLEKLDSENKLPTQIIEMLQHNLNIMVSIQDNQEKLESGEAKKSA